MDNETIPLLIRLICAFAVAFPGITIWSRSRDASWILIVLSGIFFFIDALYAALVLIGLTTYEVSWFPAVPILKSLLAALPLLLLSSAIIVKIFRSNRY